MTTKGARPTSDNAKGTTGISSSIPAGSKKLVLTVKEIVNCPEAEIYAMLKECNMDPNDAVNRLLTQDPFHEVKSKRDKKKETKDSSDLRSRGSTNTSNRGGRGGTDRYSGRSGLSQFSSNESSFSYNKPAYKKDNGTQVYGSSSYNPSGTAGNYENWQSLSYSDYVNTDNKTSVTAPGDGISSTSQPSSGMQPAWGGVPGQLSMADIVKLGKPHRSGDSHHDWTSKTELEVASSYHVNSNDDWPTIERPPALPSVPYVLEDAADAELYTNASKLHSGHQQIMSQPDDSQIETDAPDESLDINHVRSASISTRSMHEEHSRDSSLYDDNMYGSMGSYQTRRHVFEPNEAEDGPSSLAANFQELNLQKNDQEIQHEEDNATVVIPNHLQVNAQDCAHLSFGSFGSNIKFASEPMKNNLEETTESVDDSLMGHLESRNSEYYREEHLTNNPDENLVHRGDMNVGNYEAPSISQQDVLKQETNEAVQEHQYAFPSDLPNYNYENNQQLNAAFTHPQMSSQIQNLAPFSSVMGYTNSLPSALLGSTVQTGREPDHAYSPFPVMQQSMSTKYNNTATSIGGPSISMSEAMRQAGMTTAQANPQTLPGTGVSTGPALPQQHLTMHPYSQPTLSLGPFANMIGYPFLPQSYTYMPSAFQQTFASNNTYHQALAALPQYNKNSVSANSLAQTAAIASGYGFGSSTNIPGGNFSVNPPSAPAGTSINYDDVLSSQYKDGSHLMMSLQQQQNENSAAMWLHGAGSRTMSGIPGSTYYSLQGQQQSQQQQPSGFRQGQQPSQHLTSPGYPNYYHSQTGISLEQQQQQNARDGSSQGQAQPKQTQQLWQNGY